MGDCGEQCGNVDPYFKMPARSPDILMLAHVSKPTNEMGMFIIVLLHS